MTPEERCAIQALLIALGTSVDNFYNIEDLTFVRQAIDVVRSHGPRDLWPFEECVALESARRSADEEYDIDILTDADFDLIDALDELMAQCIARGRQACDRIIRQSRARQQREAFTGKSKTIVAGIAEVFEKYKPPLTVRQVFYQLATVGLVPLSRKGYRQAQRLLLRVRELELVPWESFADRGRERIRPSQWDDVVSFMETVNGAYRKDKWKSQPEHVEFWLEKDALSAFFAEELEPWGNPLCVVRGFSSATFVHECAVYLREIEKPKHVYYFGDHDPSGLSIEENVRERLTEFGANFTFTRIAVHLDDIETYGLRPLQAKETDSRYQRYKAKHGTRTIELDALPPDELRRRIRECVERHVDAEAWERAARSERVERESVFDITRRIESLREVSR